MSLNEENINSLIEQAKAGNEDAFAKIIEHSQNKLYQFTLYLCGNRDLAHDLCQETYLKILDKKDKLINEKALLPWLKTIARNLYFDYLKSPRNSTYTDIFEIDETKDLSGDESDINQSMDILKTLHQLEPVEREVILLVDMEGYSYSEAAQVLDIKENALRSRLHRARKSFLSIFNETK